MNSASWGTASIRKRLQALNLGPVRYYERTGSTNEDAARWAESDAPDLALVVADEQTAGRGRLGRAWHTPPGAALAFSLILKDPPDTLPPNVTTRMTALGALAACEALENRYGLTAEIKWPNDVLLGRRKVAGVLAEALWQGDTLQAVILGIGMNVTASAVPEQAALAFPAGFVEAFTGHPVDRLELLEAILAQVLAWRPQLASPAFLEAWQARLAFLSEWVSVLFADREPDSAGREMAARITGLRPDGALLVRDRSGQEHALNSGEVRLRSETHSP